MNNIVLSRSLRNQKTGSVILPLLYPALCPTRAASLNSAIHHGIRRSRGVGFGGKENPRTQNTAQGNGKRDGSRRRSSKHFGGRRAREEITGSDGKASSDSLRGRNSSYKDRDPESWVTKKEFGREQPSAVRGSRGNARGAFSEKPDTRSIGRATLRPQRDFDRSSSQKREAQNYNSEGAESISRGKEEYPSLSGRKSSHGSPARNSYKESTLSSQKPSWNDVSQGRRFRLRNDENTPRQHGSQERNFRLDGNGKPLRQFGSQEGFFKSEERGPRFDASKNSRDDEFPSQSRIDTRIPVSIPYTTPASEFLYGTSVVEAALSSRRVPRRKHYKLYIYNGSNREGSNVERDAGIERLARKNGVDVVRVSGDWLRVMDKMSGGRPHNGYILEASPLPRKPIISLGELTTTTDGKTGFKINLDYQSREEAAVNGTDDSVKYSSGTPGRKPLVLLLDSIVDPGNLGGIIRTASFLGVSAIAVSTRNSAPFTSVVLKASAGASENVTLFSVNKPAGFLVDSKAAGWKVYAAVAPSGKKDPGVPKSMTTDQLEDPLSEDPCILMLGGEGEGLRWNLRSKADIDLSIRGSGRSHNVDSLNVSVAAGILCSSFLKSNVKTTPGPIEEDSKVGEDIQPTGDLF